MPYSKKDYPDQLKNLKESARNKWIEIFNSVLKKTNDEDTAREAAWKVVGDKWNDKSYMKKKSFRQLYKEGNSK